MRAWARRLLLVFLAIALLSMATPGLGLPNQAGVKIVPTKICACGTAAAAAPSTPEFRGFPQPPSSGPAYDEQLGMTFTQSFTSLEYNVTAVAQTDPSLGTGPGYLLNGLANNGYWYQVGLSWDWAPGQSPGTGFDMNFEVFNPSGVSIYPTNGGGGVQAFTGSVNQGDIVTLNLYFGSGLVTMAARDANTGASSSVSYSSFGESYFAGVPNAVANSNGYFTGLMDEWYHGAPYYSNGAQVVFSNPTFALSSAWLWMDEFNANTLTPLFSANTPSPLTFSSPNTLREFSYNGTVEYGDAYEFITGNSSVSTSNSTVPLTFSYSVQGGGNTYSPPVLTYSSGGAQKTATLSTTASTFQADTGTAWSVSATLTGSSSSERWETEQATSGTANSPATVSLEYFHQFLVAFGYGVSGGGSGYSPPTVMYESFGTQETLLGTSSQFPLSAVWVDAGSRYNYTDPLPASSSGERWSAGTPTGVADSSGTVTMEYYNQYLLTVDASFQGSIIFPSVSLRSTSEGQSLLGTIVEGSNSFWLDSGAQYSISESVSLSQGERWVTNASTTGLISGQLTIPLAYQYQYYVAISQIGAGGGTTSAGSAWYLPGTNLTVTATPDAGWQFEGWTGVGSGSASTDGADLSLAVTGPANETATFYPGVTIAVSGPVSVSYNDGSLSGRVSPGASSVVYVPASSTISLSAGSTAFFYSFGGWSGAITSKATSVSLTVVSPETVRAGSSYNVTNIAIIGLVVVLVVLLLTVAVARARRPGMEKQGGTVGSPAA